MSTIQDPTLANVLPGYARPQRRNEFSVVPADLEHMRQVLSRVQDKIAPVWPLADYVAVNPFMGFASQDFLSAMRSIQSVSDVEMLMPLAYFKQRFSSGAFAKSDIDTAIEEMVADGIEGIEGLDVNQVVAHANEGGRPGSTENTNPELAVPQGPEGRSLRTVVEVFDSEAETAWCRNIAEEISKHCAAYYDEGQAVWASGKKESSLWLAWKNAARLDRRMEILGLRGCRALVARLPGTPDAALIALLNYLGVPLSLWHDYLLCAAFNTPGWSAWTKYQVRLKGGAEPSESDFIALLAMRLTYEVALSMRFDFHVDWSTVQRSHQASGVRSEAATETTLIRYVLQRASEIGYRRRMLGEIDESTSFSTTPRMTERRAAQMVFCIDVRSERIRRNLEAKSRDIETYGFAGFFGLPIEHVELGSEKGTAQVPVLISPQFRVGESLNDPESGAEEKAVIRRRFVRSLRKAWKQFQSSASTTFSFVETAGIASAWSLLTRMARRPVGQVYRYDGIQDNQQSQLSPSLTGLESQGISIEDQVGMAESVLRGIGILDDFARLVVFCGHGSQVENNPLKASLDCGACGGHSGEVNARFAAHLLNQFAVRRGLAERGIDIPNDTWFVGAVHNTTTDEIEFFDRHLLPGTHHPDLATLESHASSASALNRLERWACLPGADPDSLKQRSIDWSEVRPEWGLAGNAAFIAAPRRLTESLSLNGRAFLHSYDVDKDPGFQVLEQIITAPLVVANWINMQYYASTVDPKHFGSGNKTVHNVVGRFGLYSGNGGDLMTGLPWQSIHDGKDYQHHPLRLLAVVAAPRDAVTSILERHESIRSLITNGWLNLVVLESDAFYRLTSQGTWTAIAGNTIEFCRP